VKGYELLKRFVAWDPDLVQRMRSCDHAFSSSLQNPFHLEGDVWSHTMMVFKFLLDAGAPADALVAALCHDTGKVFTRNVRNFPRVNFHSHDAASVQPTVDFLSTLPFGTVDPQRVLTAVNYHMVVHEKGGQLTKDRVLGVCSYDPETVRVLELLARADHYGSVAEDEEPVPFGSGDAFAGAHEVASLCPAGRVIEDCDVVVFSGMPGSGKDFISAVTLPHHRILSFDDLRIKIYRDRAGEEAPADPKELYQAAWTFCAAQEIDLLRPLTQEARELLGRGEKVSICNTSLTMKSRRALLNMLPREARVGACYVAAPSYEVVTRDANRKSKTVGADVIHGGFMFRQWLPTMGEGFSAVRFLMNIPMKASRPM
jgi:hypothetical protein